MIDQDLNTLEGGIDSTNNTAGNTRKQNVGEQAAAAGRDFKARAGEFAGASADKLKDQASSMADTAKGVADQAGDKLKEAVTERKAAGADYVGNLAEAIRRAGREFDNELPIAGKYIRKAASQIDNVADSIRTGDFNDLLKNAQSFARRQPTAFLGIAALAGFAAVRILKSSSSEAGRSSSGAAARETGYRDEFRN
jgi:ElaB/YqjD/DUF883 family membrane-anchored ribosome-binding protein